MAELVKDPVCGMEIDQEAAAGKSEYEGTTYYFCAEGCQKEFDADPQKFVGGGEASAAEAPAEEKPAEEAAEAPAEAPGEEKPAKRWWEFWKS